MPDTCEEVFPFATKEISEGEVAANFPLSELDEMDPEDFYDCQVCLDVLFERG